MSLRSLEVSGVMCGRDLHDSGTEFHIYHLITYDGDLFVHYGKYDRSAYELLVSLILRVYCECLICEECLWTSRGDKELLISACDEVVHIVHLLFDLSMLHFDIRYHRFEGRGVVHHVLSAVYESFVIQIDEYIFYEKIRLLIECISLMFP